MRLIKGALLYFTVLGFKHELALVAAAAGAVQHQLLYGGINREIVVNFHMHLS